MAREDPFAEPGDADRTVIRPNPGGRLGPVAPLPFETPAVAEPQPAPAPQPQPAQGGGAAAGETLAAAMTGLNRLNAAAATLFALVSRIRNRAQHPDPDALRRSVMAEIRAFESRALQAGIDPRQVKVARYAICATLDDVVLNTPWGGTSVWAQQSMVGTFHRETVGGDRFYDLLARLEQDPANNIELLEFLYMCLSLGFEGRLRVDPGGAEKHLEIRAGLARLIRAQRGEVEHELSPHWQGIDRPHRPLSLWRPVWIAVAGLATVLLTTFLGLSWTLSNATGGLTGQIAAIAGGPKVTLDRPAPPVAPAPLDETQLNRVKGFLAEEIDEGLVTVFQDANTITVRLAGSGMFASGAATLKEEFDVPLDRVTAALDETQGPIIVAGHSDNVPIRSARFPSNLALSLARAESVMQRIAEDLDDPSRLKAEGRADREPIAPNDTAEGRAQNRRIEIVLVRTEAS